MTFSLPFVFLLLPLPLLIRRWPLPAAGGLWVPPHVFSGMVSSPAAADRLGPALLMGAWVAIVAALAGPTVPRTSGILPASGRDIVLALDLSGSMEKTDFVLDGQQISRLDAVKRTASGFARARRGDRIGLVIFGERSYFAQPLTYDVDAVARAIETAQIGVSGRSTAISDGLGLAMKRLAASDAPTRVVVLLSDGVDTSGTVQAVDAARLAATHGIRVHTIALGPDDLESQPASRDAVDARTLRQMAEVGGGTSFRVRGMQDLVAMAATLDRLEPNPSQRPPLILRQPLWPWLGAAALLLLTIHALRRRS